MNTRIIKSGRHYEVAVTTDRSGRLSVVVSESGWGGRKLVDVELPAKSGEYKDAFKPIVHVCSGVEVEETA